jgi:mannose-6-phosphate isomerase-like protein (cupin superfamily)
MQRPIRRVEKPWGYELIFAHTDRYVGKILHVDPGQALSLQYHEVKDETLYLAEGEVQLLVEEGGELVQRVLGAGESYRITPLTRHRMIAGEAGCDIIEVSTPELDDVVRLEDRYGRVSGEAEKEPEEAQVGE